MPGSGPDYCLILIERECICHVMHPLCFSKPDKVCHRCMRCVSCILSSVGNLTINIYICPIFAGPLCIKIWVISFSGLTFYAAPYFPALYDAES